jgi:hypothetical protein
MRLRSSQMSSACLASTGSSPYSSVSANRDHDPEGKIEIKAFRQPQKRLNEHLRSASSLDFHPSSQVRALEREPERANRHRSQETRSQARSPPSTAIPFDLRYARARERTGVRRSARISETEDRPGLRRNRYGEIPARSPKWRLDTYARTPGNKAASAAIISSWYLGSEQSRSNP